MAKKSKKQASGLFHNIMKASVTPKMDEDIVFKAIGHIREEIAIIIPGWEDFTLLKGNSETKSILLEFSHDCPNEIEEKIRAIVKNNADLIGIMVVEL